MAVSVMAAALPVIFRYGKIYLSEHLMSACARLGISVQPRAAILA